MMYASIITGVWLCYVCINICIAECNDRTRRARIKAGNTNQINHPVWAGIYCLLCAPAYLLFKDWWLIGSIVLLHLSVFPVAYNHFAELPAFYLSRTTAALTDRLMVWFGLKSTELVNLLALAGSIALLIKSIYNG